MRVFLFVLLFSFSAFAEEAHQAELRAFAAYAAAQMKAQQMPGLSVAVRYGDFTWSGGFGLADVENGVPATAASSYRMASVTKPMTAIAVLKLADEGKIDLDAEVQTYVPYFPRKRYPVTVRQLLAHQGGISHYKDYEKEGRIRDPKSMQEAIAIFGSWDLMSEPGTEFRYTSYGFNLLGAVIEGASGRTYAQYMRDNVWTPLGMDATVVDDPRAIIPHRVDGYVLEEGVLRRSEYVDTSSRLAGGGTRATVDDMIRLFDGIGQGKVLKPETRERAWSMQPTRDGRLTRYGYGFGLYVRNGRSVVAHTGSQQETRTSVMLVPNLRLAIALASNFENADLDPFEDELIELLLGDPRPIAARGSDAATTEIAKAIFSIYNNGLAYYERHGRAMTTDSRELDAAFRYVRDALTKADAKMIADGANPVAGEPFTKAGSYMASVLGAPDAGVYHREGALRFFADYLRIAKGRRFGRALDGNIVRWSAEWARLWTPELRTIDFSEPLRALDVLEQAQPLFDRATIRPDYGRELKALAESGDANVAARARKLLDELR